MYYSYVINVLHLSLKCLVSKFAENQEKLRLHRWPDVDIQPGQFDVGIVASFGQLLPRKFINLFP